MSFAFWLLAMGALLLFMAVLRPTLPRLPITGTIIYLLFGIALGPLGFGVLIVDPMADSTWVHHSAEVAVIISLFTVGMKLRLPITAPGLRPALTLATLSMVITVALVAAAGVTLLGLSWGEGVLLGAIIAPTDPVLASDVQMKNPRDRETFRLTLTAEGGLNDGTAFPFVMLGLGLLGLHDIGANGWRWWTVDVAWAISGGLAIGGGLGFGIGQLLLRLQSRRRKPIAFGEYIVLGLIGLSYGLAVECKTYGFLSVFAAGLALRTVERKASPSDNVLEASAAASGTAIENQARAADPRTAPAHLAGVLLATNEQLEHLLEVALVLIVGAALFTAGFSFEALWFAPLLFLIIRPLAALPLLAIRPFSRGEFGVIAWFGIRGIGSLYYLMYAIEHGVADEFAGRLASITLTLITLSILVHGVSVSPLLARYIKENRR